MSILIKNISYLDIEREKIIDGADIFIEENKIKKIGENLKLQADEVFNGENKLLTPGFVNATLTLACPTLEIMPTTWH